MLMSRLARRLLLASTLMLTTVWPSASFAQGKPHAAGAPPPRAQALAFGLFSNVRVFRPAGTPRQFVLLVSGSDSPSAGERQMIAKMVGAGAMVAAVPLAPFYRRLEAQDGKCTYAAGAFENLSRQVQAYEKLAAYLPPMIVGAGSSASVAYAVLAQAPAGTFASAMSIGFCPRLPLKTPLCAAHALHWQRAADGGIDLQPEAELAAPWTALQAGSGAACPAGAAQAFVQQVPHATWVAVPSAPSASTPVARDVPPTFGTAYTALVEKQRAAQAAQPALDPAPAHLAGLPIVEVPVSGAGTRFAVLLSGDGGWAGIDKDLAAAFAAKGVPVVGFDSLRYFWTARTPEGLAADLDRIVRYYANQWRRSDVILVGYSQGADVLPFALNRLPAATRSRVRLTALLGLGQKASFEFHLANWIGTSGDRPIAPEAGKLSAAGTVCVYGQDERDSLCPELAPAHARAIPLAGGHHFGGDYDALAARILDAMPR
jgi:type IV secretory pathway VirJ component